MKRGFRKCTWHLCASFQKTTRCLLDHRCAV